MTGYGDAEAARDETYVRDRCCQMCTSEDYTPYSVACRRPGTDSDCRLQAAIDRLTDYGKRGADRP